MRADQPSAPLYLYTMPKEAVLTLNAPPPLPGIYSQAIKAGGMVYCSGAVPMDAKTGKLIDGDVKAHTVSRMGLVGRGRLTGL